MSNFASLSNDRVTCCKQVREIVKVVSWRQNTHTASEHTAVSWDEVGEARNAQAFGKHQLEWPRRRRKVYNMTCVCDKVFENGK